MIGALLGALKVGVPMNAGISRIGRTQIGTEPENSASNTNPEAIDTSPAGLSHGGLDLSK